MNSQKHGSSSGPTLKANIKRPAFVVHCKDCKKVQAASVADDESDREIRKAISWLRSAVARNKEEARRLSSSENLPDADLWCDCKKSREQKKKPAKATA